MLLHAAKYLREGGREREREGESPLKQYALGEKSVLTAEKFLFEVKGYAIGGKAL